MSLNQENLNAAKSRGSDTLRRLLGPVNLRDQHVRTLQGMAWDLEAIQTAIRSEINDRMGGASGGMDLG